MSLDSHLIRVLPQLCFGVLLAGVIVTLAAFDIRRMILPNRLNLLLGAIGLAQNIALDLPGLIDGLIGSLVGAGLLYVTAISFRKIRGIEGLGLGDQKFVAAAGLWIGWKDLPLMLLVAAMSALTFIVLSAIARENFDPTARIPFGPFLGLGAFVSWLFMVTS